MSSIVEVKNLSKNFIISHESSERYRALRDVVTEKAKKLFSFPSSLGNGRTREEFWALKDVSFNVEEGDRIGIIGRNGAGKSTLLKILSRITEPTLGEIRLRGRVAALLEVGTGFHPELSGRENIFLNGAILGMRGSEIKRHFDAIVDFAEIEKFLDTPVKRYSSGMYVRLAFAVAAHLEPEILIVDEVLAVGDAQFQRKCLGKMEDVSKNEGRTILFVSHNISAIKVLTTKGFYLKNGQLEFAGSTEDAVKAYSIENNSTGSEVVIKGSGKHTKIISAIMVDKDGNVISNYTVGTPLFLNITLDTDGSPGLSFEVFLRDYISHNNIAIASLAQLEGMPLPNSAGRYSLQIQLQPLLLASGSYYFTISTSITNVSWDHWVEASIEFEVSYSNPRKLSWDFKSSFGYGNFALLCEEVSFEKIQHSQN